MQLQDFVTQRNELLYVLPTISTIFDIDINTNINTAALTLSTESIQTFDTNQPPYTTSSTESICIPIYAYLTL